MRRNSPPVGIMAAAGLDHPLDLNVWPHSPSFAALTRIFLWCTFKSCDENAAYFEGQEAQKSVLRNARIACFWVYMLVLGQDKVFGTERNVPLSMEAACLAVSDRSYC